jgi:methylated-DNA-[protein]-cysteine S-methyltransferase
MQLRRCRLQTPLGEFILMASTKGLVSLQWADGMERTDRHLSRHLGASEIQDVSGLPGLSDCLLAYTRGDIHSLKGLPVDPPGTAFQRTVWAALVTIPVGKTWSYAQLARAIGKPTATRAVANANGKNPIPIVIPCHRVIASGGGIGGFSGGIHRKEWLLHHEGSLTG